MTALASPSNSVFVIRAGVPGRARLGVAGLKGDGAEARRLARSLSGDGAIFEFRPSALTGRALVLFDPALTADEIARRVAAARTRPTGRAVSSEVSWHAADDAAVTAALRVDRGHGLTGAEARRRLSAHGPNRLPLPRRRSRAAIVAGQFASLPVALLAGSALVSLATGGLFDGLVVLAVVALNGAIGAATEIQAERTIARLEAGRRPVALVRRDGRVAPVAAEEVVPGDLLVLSPGQTVAADARLIEADGLAADESILTGESQPAFKEAGAPLPPGLAPADRSNMVWRGTLIGSGAGLAVVVATGRDTEIGRIQMLVGDVATSGTPLQRRLDALGRNLIGASMLACLGVGLLGLLRGQGMGAAFRTASALAVAAIPEGLPTVATAALALAVRDLERKGVLVRRLDAVEAMGQVATVFFDKTGTLTLNRMNVAEADSSRRLWEVAALCSDATALPDGRGGWRIEGSPTEAALLQAAIEAGVDVAALRLTHPRLSERYRDGRRQTMCTRHAVPEGGPLTAIKGNPDEVLEACAKVFVGDAEIPLDGEARRAIAGRNEEMAARGMRVLGFASGTGGETGLAWLGLAGLADPPRPGVEDFVRALHRSGIGTVMLTGDQAATARAVAVNLGLVPPGGARVADSAAIEALAPDELAELARITRVFARIQPADKLKVVEAYRRDGQVVAMVGDGINDGPALKAADVGVTMGRRGSRAARDLSDIVLENDDLAGLIAAVERGRLTYDNIRKAVGFLLATNLSEILLTAASTGLGLGSPLSPAQLLWINLVSDVLPALALSREPAEAGALERRPPSPGQPFIERAEARRLGREAAIIAASALAAHAWGTARVGPDAARTVAATGLLGAQMLHALSSRSRRRGLFLPGGGARNSALSLAVGGTVALHGLALAARPLRRLLGLAPPGAAGLAAAGAAAVIPYLVNEAMKYAEAPRPSPAGRRSRAGCLRSGEGRLPMASWSCWSGGRAASP